MADDVTYGYREGDGVVHIVESARGICGRDFTGTGVTFPKKRWHRYESKDEIPDDLDLCGQCAELHENETYGQLLDEIRGLIDSTNEGDSFTKEELVEIRDSLK